MPQMRRSVFAPTFILALIFIAAKADLAWPLVHSIKGLNWIVGASAEDVAVAVGLGIATSLALRLASRRPRVQKIIWGVFVLVGAIAAVYSVANIGIFRSLGYPLNVRMFSLIGRFTDMRSSIEARCQPGLISGMIVALLVFVIATNRRLRIVPPVRVRTTLLVLAGLWIGYGFVLRAQAEPGSWMTRAGPNPHREMLESLVSKYLLNGRAHLDEAYPPEFTNDFKPTIDTARPVLSQFQPPPKNVILIVLESTSAQYMSLYGAKYNTTPNLLNESRHALLVDRFYSNVGFTYRSMVPLAFAVYPGLPWRYRTDLHEIPGPGLAGVLKDRGYRTAFLAAANPDWGGMDWMAHTAGFTEVIGPKQLGGPQASSWGTDDGTLVSGLIKWIDANRDHPFFVAAWTDQTHDPYLLTNVTQPKQFINDPSLRHGQQLNRYLNAMRQTDQELERLFTMLREKHLADDTLVVITGDHGEAFANVHDVISHGTGLFDECNRVPMMFWNPRLFPTAQHMSKVGAHVDINPTIAHILGVEPLPQWQGISLFSPDHPGRAYMFVDLAGYQFAVADSRYKYVLHYTGGFQRLYDLVNDPLEQVDLSTQQPQIAVEMRGRISAFVHAEEAYLNSQRQK